MCSERVPADTPVVIGVGQTSERVGDAAYRAMSPVELAAGAARRALSDSGAVNAMVDAIEVVAAVRQFEASGPEAIAPLGCSDNFPRSVGDRIGARPRYAVLDVVGGQSPQKLLTEYAARIAGGGLSAVLIVGAEAISTVRHYTGRPGAPDFSETRGGQLEDRGYGLDGLISKAGRAHGLLGTPGQYALCEHARRTRQGLSRDAYARAMGTLFAPFTEIAANNPHSSAPTVRSAEELITLSDRNRMIADPYSRFLVARDQVNQGAAVLLCSAATAQRYGVDPSRLVFVHGHADLVERPLLERPHLGRSPAATAASRAALHMARSTVDDISVFDLYSCFPIAVFNVCEGIGLETADRRGLTVTGGLPFFGGAGNNYSMHAIAEMVQILRSTPGAKGLVGANGGILSKYSAAVYSTEPAPWQPGADADLQRRLDEVPVVPPLDAANGPARVESFTTVHAMSGPRHVVVAQTARGERFYANVRPEDKSFHDLLTDGEPIGQRVHATTDDGLNWVSLSANRLAPRRREQSESY